MVVVDLVYPRQQIRRCRLGGIQFHLCPLDSGVSRAEVVALGPKASHRQLSFRGIEQDHNLPFCGHMSEMRVGAWRDADCGCALPAGASEAVPYCPAHRGRRSCVYVPVNTTIVVIITAGRLFVHEFQADD